MRLTIFVPLLGSLVLFNHELVEWAKLSEAAVRIWLKVPPTDPAEAARQYTISRLHKLYLGLTALGVGAGLYGFFCPRQVKQYGSSGEYIAALKPTMTSARSAVLFSRIWHEMPPAGLQTLRLASQSVSGANDPEKLSVAELSASLSQSPNNVRDGFATDVLDMHYAVRAQENRPARVAVAAAYVIGFAFLLYPSSETFIQILWSLWKL